MKKSTKNAKFKPVVKIGELVPKYLKYEEFECNKITSSDDVARIMRSFFDVDQIAYREFFYIIYLNRNNEVIGVFKASMGGISYTVVDTKLVFGQAFLIGASGIILCHNHPSGNLKPSNEDINLTTKIDNGCKYLDIQLLDHVIMTETSHYSFKNEGLL